MDYPTEFPQPAVRHDEGSREFWQTSGQQILKETLGRKEMRRVAKNLIILVADGMSIPTQMATRMYMGGEEKVLSFEKFPHVGLAKVRRKVFHLNNKHPEKFVLQIVRRHIAWVIKFRTRRARRRLSLAESKPTSGCCRWAPQLLPRTIAARRLIRSTQFSSSRSSRGRQRASSPTPESPMRRQQVRKKVESRS